MEPVVAWNLIVGLGAGGASGTSPLNKIGPPESPRKGPVALDFLPG